MAEPPKTSKSVRTRRRLVEVTLELLLESGESAITTVAVTKRASMAQSSFYFHFDSVEALMREAGRSTGEALAAQLGEWMEELRSAEHETLDGLLEHLERVFDRLRQDRTYVEVFVRFRRSPFVLGEVLREVEERFRLLIRAHVNVLAEGYVAEYGASVRAPAPYPELAADMLIEQALAAADLLFRNEALKSRTLARVVASSMFGMMQSLFIPFELRHKYIYGLEGVAGTT